MSLTYAYLLDAAPTAPAAPYNAAGGVADFSQYYDPATYWQNYSQTWSANYEASAAGQQAAYYQQQQQGTYGQQDGAAAAISHAAAFNQQHNDDLSLVGECVRVKLFAAASFNL